MDAHGRAATAAAAVCIARAVIPTRRLEVLKAAAVHKVGLGGGGTAQPPRYAHKARTAAARAARADGRGGSRRR